MPEAIILGSGTSNGVPMLGVTYPSGYLANPKNHRSRACLALLGPEGNVLVDCPPELRLQCTGAQIDTIDAVIVTHSHADHVMGMDDLRSICMKTGRAVPVYTLERYQADIRRIFNYAFQEYPKGVFVPRFDLRDIQPFLDLGGMRIETLIVEHGQVPVIGIRVNDFAYVTDVSRIPDRAMAQLKGLEFFVVDATRHAPHPNHFHLSRALEVAEEVGARTTYLTHLGSDYDHDLSEAELPSGIKLAYDGLRLEI